MRPLVLLLLTLCVLAATARAQDAIHHCVDAHGNPVFTDQPCASLQATPVQAPPSAASATAPGAPVPLQHCAATAAELRKRVIGAFAARDPNRLAGLMLWRGYGGSSTVGDLRALAQLVRQPLLEIHFDNAPDGAAATPSVPMETLQLRTDGGDQANFAVVQQAGCLWLHYAD
ncbi:MAG: hypothetical protein RSP_03120 [Rhodanobacter sp.]